MLNGDSEDSPPPPKRASTRAKRGQAAVSQQSVPVSSRAEPQQSIQAASSVQEASPAVASIAPPLSIEQPSLAAPIPNHILPSGQGPAQATHPPDINTVISDIINHGETVESHCASQGNTAMGMVDTESYSQLGASLHLKLQSLPILDNLVSRNA